MQSRSFAVGRHAGLLLPLFSMPSTRSWGIGEIGDLAAFGPWLEAAGLDILQVLPLNEMASGQCSPYSALSAMAIDPIYITVEAMEDLKNAGGDPLDGNDRAALAAARSSPSVDYRTVRAVKAKALRVAFDRFYDAAWLGGGARADQLNQYLAAQAWWIEDYGLFRALHEREGPDRSWRSWPAGLRDREPDALAWARGELSREILFYQYLQWVADTQWQEARRAMANVGIFGDFPFMVATDSADVWANQHEFWLDASVGTPPDAFSETGQDWGLPVYRWAIQRDGDFRWLRQRARRSAALYDGYRVDHLVGFYRTFVRPPGGEEPFFTPADEHDQTALGEYLLGVFRAAGAFVFAEDLGTVPDFVRDSLVRLSIAGYKVLRWEREWKRPGKPFCDPSRYPEISVATTGTHDTEPMAVWWDEAEPDDKAAFLSMPGLCDLGEQAARAAYTPTIRDAVLDILYGSGSSLLILPIQDLFGWRDQINVPATVADTNWTYRLPCPVDELGRTPEAGERAAALKRLAETHGRRGGGG